MFGHHEHGRMSGRDHESDERDIDPEEELIRGVGQAWDEQEARKHGVDCQKCEHEIKRIGIVESKSGERSGHARKNEEQPEERLNIRVFVNREASRAFGQVSKHEFT